MQKNLSCRYFNGVFALKSFSLISTLCIALSMMVSFGYGQAQLLKDINTHEDVLNNEYSSFTNGYGKIYFINNLNELWKTTGNTGGTIRLKSFNQIKNLTLVGTTLYFSADDGSGMELWKSTGTFAGTVKVKEFIPGIAGGRPEFLTNVDGALYFVAYTPMNGRELWKTDGTEAGTVLVKDILRVKGSSNPSGLTYVNGTLYFSANDGKNGYEIWKTDGSANGTVMVKDIRPGAYLGSTPEFLTNVNGTLYFVAFDGIYGRELWRSNGTASTTIRLGDIRPGMESSAIENLTAVNNTLFFTANDGTHGHELWKSDGSEAGTVLVKDMTPGRAGSHGEVAFTHKMGNFKSVYGLLYYTAYQNDTYYIWKSDGTESGTVPLHISSHNINQPTPRFVPMNNYIYYFDSSEDEYSDNEFHLYRMNPDGSNPVIIATLFTEDFYSVYNPELIELSKTLYFNAQDNQSHGLKLFRSNGSPGSMVLIKDTHKVTLNSELNSMVKTGNNKVFFVAEEEAFSSSLWRTDGTPEGTIKLQEFDRLISIVATSTHVYYSLNSGLEIWKSDGTPEGTALVKADPNLRSAFNLVNVNDMVYFQSYNAGLWRTDGTEAGTISLPGTENVWYMKAVGNLLLFTVTDGNHGVKLWRSNGMVTGTYSIYTFSGKQQPLYTPTAVKGNVMFFVADDGISGNEVWRTNGTTPGTYQIADLHAQDNHLEGPYEYDIRSLGVWNNNLYISAFDNTGNWGLYKSNGNRGNATKLVNLTHPVVEIIPAGERLHFLASVTEYPWNVNNWVTDGTIGGTHLLGDPFLYTFWSFDYTIVNKVLYYNAYDEDLWRSDGTTCGTYPVELGVDGSNPMENIGDLLVFRGHSPQYGNEPFVYNLAKAPQSPCGTPMMAAKHGSMESLMATSEEGYVATYPNPFTHDFSLRVNGSESDFIHVEVYNTTGFLVETFRDLKANSDFRLGTTWPVGLYILIINSSGKMTRQKVIKK